MPDETITAGMFSVEINGVNRVENALRKLAAEMPELCEEVVYKWAQETRAVLKSTPYPEKNRNPMIWESDKQRRYVMMMIRKGEIKVPYRRTGNLANRWVAARIPGGAIITNRAAYSKFVVGDAKGDVISQYWMHRNRWWLAREIIDRETKNLTPVLAAALRKEWESAV